MQTSWWSLGLPSSWPGWWLPHTPLLWPGWWSLHTPSWWPGRWSLHTPLLWPGWWSMGTLCSGLVDDHHAIFCNGLADIQVILVLLQAPKVWHWLNPSVSFLSQRQWSNLTAHLIPIKVIRPSCPPRSSLSTRNHQRDGNAGLFLGAIQWRA